METKSLNGLILFIGESFRTGGQTSRIRGKQSSVAGQMEACKSHRQLLDQLQSSGNKTHVFIATYTTPFTEQLLEIYRPELIDSLILPDPIGLNNLFRQSTQKLCYGIPQYDYVFYCRIDLCFKETFYETFRPERFSTIQFPTICWYHACTTKHGYPRVNDTMLFIPKRYFSFLSFIEISHDTWQNLVERTPLTSNDMDTFISTYHDSDTQKDFNPLYFIVNRPMCAIFHSPNQVFQKTLFRQKEKIRNIFK